MSQYYYYLKMDDGRHIVHGPYPLEDPESHGWNSHVVKVWREGPKGGIKITRDLESSGIHEYITQNEAAMKEFAWVKLSATQPSEMLMGIGIRKG